MRYAVGIVFVFLGLPLMMLPLIGSIIAWPFIIVGFIFIASAISASNAKRISRETSKLLAANTERGLSNDETSRRWAVLCEIDPEIQQAAARVRPLGEVAERELMTKFMTLNDKRYLTQLVHVIEARFGRR